MKPNVQDISIAKLKNNCLVTYLVGGAVRDLLLGLSPSDRNYVVVGSTEKEMIDLGFKKVGAHFPVFLHPETGEEYALARKDEKIREVEFSSDVENVTIEEDLKRRDLTINAIAINGENDIDPCGGISDLKLKILRHVSDAFSQDPLRVFRVARFAARFPDFEIADETIEKMKKVVLDDAFKLLSQERVFQELKTALSYNSPSRFFTVLKQVNALEFYFPELFALIDVPQPAKYHPEGCIRAKTRRRN